MRVIRSAVFLIALASAGCSPRDQYSGDGTLIDHGSAAANERFVVQLGDLDLGQQVSKTFHLSGLPAENFVVGLEVPPATSVEISSDVILNAHVTLTLADESGAALFSATGPLREWVWSDTMRDGAVKFVYKRAPSGTFFDASPESKYTLTTAVNVPAHSTSLIRIVLKSAGWK